MSKKIPLHVINYAEYKTPFVPDAHEEFVYMTLEQLRKWKFQLKMKVFSTVAHKGHYALSHNIFLIIKKALQIMHNTFQNPRNTFQILRNTF